MIVLKIVLIILLLLILWLSVKYVLLLCAKRNADIVFNKFLKKLKEHAEVVDLLLEESMKYPDIDKDKINETKEYISKLQGFSVEKDGNERIIGYTNAVFNNVRDMYTVMYASENKTEILTKYNALNKEFETEKNAYNTSAGILKHYADVFPTSLFARLKNIRTMDFVN